MLKTSIACRNFPHMVRLLEERIYKRRKRMRISQEALAERAGLTRNCIQQMECYEHIPKTSTLFAVMKALAFSEEESAAFWRYYQEAYRADRELQRRKEEELKPV